MINYFPTNIPPHGLGYWEKVLQCNVSFHWMKISHEIKMVEKLQEIIQQPFVLLI